MTQGILTSDSTCADLVGKVAHADLVAAVAYADGRDLRVEYVVYLGVVFGDVASAHVAVLALVREAAALYGDKHGRAQIRQKARGELPALGLVRYGEFHDAGVVSARLVHDLGGVAVGEVDDLVSELVERASYDDGAGRAVRLGVAGVQNVESGDDDGGSGVVQREPGGFGGVVCGEMRTQLRDAAPVSVKDDVFDGHCRVLLTHTEARGTAAWSGVFACPRDLSRVSMWN